METQRRSVGRGGWEKDRGSVAASRARLCSHLGGGLLSDARRLALQAMGADRCGGQPRRQCVAANPRATGAGLGKVAYS